MRGIALQQTEQHLELMWLVLDEGVAFLLCGLAGLSCRAVTRLSHSKARGHAEHRHQLHVQYLKRFSGNISSSLKYWKLCSKHLYFLSDNINKNKLKCKERRGKLCLCVNVSVSLVISVV